MSTTSGTVSLRAQSRCSSQPRDTQLTGLAPAWTIRSSPARSELSGWALRGHAGVDPLLESVDLGLRPGAIAGHLPAAHGAQDGVGVIGDVCVVEQVKGAQHRFAVLVAEQGPNVLLEAEGAVGGWQVESSFVSGREVGLV